MPTDTSAPAAVRVPGAGVARSRPRRPRRPARAAGQILPRLLLTVFGIFFVLLLIWLLLAATKTDAQLVQDNPLSFGSWHALRQNWDALTGFQGDAILLWLRNSALYAFLALVITLAVGIPAGYALAMMEFPGRRLLLITTLVVMLTPTTTPVVPLFLEVNAVHLIGSLWSVVLPYSFYPFGVYLTYIYFSTALPRDLLDAARIDGATEFAAFRRILGAAARA